jgi:hypothetical protein
MSGNRQWGVIHPDLLDKVAPYGPRAPSVRTASRPPHVRNSVLSRMPSARSPVLSFIRQEGCVRVLVYPHTTEIGGCQLNAVETAGAVRERGECVPAGGAR